MRKFSLTSLILVFGVIVSALVFSETIRTLAYIDGYTAAIELSQARRVSSVKPKGTVAGAATCGLTDATVRTLPNLSLPAKGGSFIDPTYGCKITRLSNALAEGSSYVMHAYSSVNPFNSDNTKVLLEKSGGVLHIRNLSGNITRDNLQTYGILPASNPVWSRSDPNVIYFHPAGGNQLKSFNIGTGEVKALKTFSNFTQITFGNGEGDISIDGDHLAISADDFYAFIYTISTGAMSPVGNISSRVAHPDSIDITPGNNLAITGLDGVYYYGQQMNFLGKATVYGGHSDRAKDQDGSDLTIITNSNDSTNSLPNCQNGIVKVNLFSGRQTCLQQLDWSLAVHISCNNGNQGWCIVSTYDPSHAGAWKAYTDEILLVNLNSSQTIRLAHTRSSNSAYERFPRAALSGNGRYVLFDSDMRGANVDTYLLDLQNGSTTPSPSPSPTPTSTPLPSLPPPPPCSNLTGYASNCNSQGVPILSLIQSALSQTNISVSINLPTSPVNVIYNTGYYWSQTRNQWVSFTFDGMPYSGSTTWLKDAATTNLIIPRSDLRIGANYIITWDYIKNNTCWTGPAGICGTGKWRVAVFNIK